MCVLTIDRCEIYTYDMYTYTVRNVAPALLLPKITREVQKAMGECSISSRREQRNSFNCRIGV